MRIPSFLPMLLTLQLSGERGKSSTRSSLASQKIVVRVLHKKAKPSNALRRDAESEDAASERTSHKALTFEPPQITVHGTREPIIHFVGDSVSFGPCLRIGEGTRQPEVSMPTRSVSVWLHDTSHVKVSYTESHEE